MLATGYSIGCLRRTGENDLAVTGGAGVGGQADAAPAKTSLLSLPKLARAGPGGAPDASEAALRCFELAAWRNGSPPRKAEVRRRWRPSTATLEPRSQYPASMSILSTPLGLLWTLSAAISQDSGRSVGDVRA